MKGLYAILSDGPAGFTLDALPDAAAALASVGVAQIQVRLKGAHGDRAASAVHDRVVARLYDWDGLLVVNDRADLAHLVARRARAEGLRLRVGLHLGQNDLPPRAARDIVGPDVAIGLSTHDRAQLEAAFVEPIDHVAFGPIFATRSKADPDPVVGLARLAEAAALAHARGLPLVAIGGLARDTLAATAAAGADACAVIGALGADVHDLARRARELAQILAEAR